MKSKSPTTIRFSQDVETMVAAALSTEPSLNVSDFVERCIRQACGSNMPSTKIVIRSRQHIAIQEAVALAVKIVEKGGVDMHVTSADGVHSVSLEAQNEDMAMLTALTSYLAAEHPRFDVISIAYRTARPEDAKKS